MTVPIFLSRAHFPVTTLGPGRRLGIWLQGCSIQCAGCISADTWGSGRGKTTVLHLLDAVSIWLAQADGVTVSGGEPFDQPQALQELLEGIRAHSDIDIFVYSGYSMEVLEPRLSRFAGLIDALISDPYDRQAPQSLVLRGSDNQRLHLLTPLGQARFASLDRESVAGDKRFDVMMDDDGTLWLAGIPVRDDFERLKHLLERDGHHIVTTEDISAHRRARIET